MAEKKRKIEIVDLITGEVVETIETKWTGKMYDQLISGLQRKVDLNKFYIGEEDGE